MTSNVKISLKLLVDTETNKVVFAESNEDFVDAIFSFLAIPIGVVVHLTGKQSTVGCIDRLYDSIEKLEGQKMSDVSIKDHVTTKLQDPICSRVFKAQEDLNQIRPIPPSTETITVTLKKKKKGEYFIITVTRFFSSFCNSGIRRDDVDVDDHLMEVQVPRVLETAEEENGLLFLNAEAKFVIRDDFLAKPIRRATSTFSLLQSMGIHVGSKMEEKIVTISGVNEMLNLLKRSLVSSSPLSDIFLPPTVKGKAGQEIKLREAAHYESDDEKKPTTTDQQGATEGGGGEGGVTIKLIQTKINSKVLYAEAGEDFVNLLFDFLTYPLGSLASIFDGYQFSCFRNLKQSVGDLETCDYFKSEESKKKLISPEQSSLYDVGVDMDFGASERYKTSRKSDSGYVSRKWMFMVTDELEVSPLSYASGVSILQKFNIPIEGIEECEVVVGPTEARNLLMAALTTRIALTKAFLG